MKKKKNVIRIEITQNQFMCRNCVSITNGNKEESFAIKLENKPEINSPNK